MSDGSAIVFHWQNAKSSPTSLVLTNIWWLWQDESDTEEPEASAPTKPNEYQEVAVSTHSTNCAALTVYRLTFH